MHRKTSTGEAHSGDTSTRRSRPEPALLLGLVMALSGCGIWGGGYDDRDGPRIADTIRNAGANMVASVDYRPGNAMDPALVTVKLREGASKDAAVEFVCSVVRPTIDLADAPVGLGVDIWDSRGEQLLATESVSCEEPASSG